MITANPRVGDVVRVRSRPWLVESVKEGSTHQDSVRVQLSCLQDDAIGETLPPAGRTDAALEDIGRRYYKTRQMSLGVDEGPLFQRRSKSE